MARGYGVDAPLLQGVRFVVVQRQVHMALTVHQTIALPQLLLYTMIDVPVVQVERVPSAVVDETVVRFMRHEARSHVLWGLVHWHRARVTPAIRAENGWRGRRES